MVLISIWCLLNWASLKWFGLFAHPLWSRGHSNCFVLWFIRLSIILWFVEVKCKIEQPLLWTYHLRVAQMVKNPPVMEETQVWSLGPEDPLEKGMATHLSIFPWRIPWTEEPGGLQSMGFQSQTQLRDQHFHFELTLQYFTTLSLIVMTVNRRP